MGAIQKLKDQNPLVLKISAGVSVVVLLVVLYPFQTIVVPAWSLQVVDDQGANVQGINVTQHWQHNLLESVGHEEVQRTDGDGRVLFARRTIRANLFTRARLAGLKLLREGRKAKFNKYASVVAWGSKENQTNVAVYEGEGTPPTQLVAARVDLGSL